MTLEERVAAIERAARAVVAQNRIAATREKVMRTLLDVREQRIRALERELERERRVADEATRWAARVERELLTREESAPEPVVPVRRRRAMLRRAS